LLTGDVPFQSSNVWTLADEVMNHPPAPPSLRVSGLDMRLEAVCLKALQKRPEDRYRSMEEFALALADYLGGAPMQSRVGGPQRVPVLRERIRFVFVGYGERAPAQAGQRDRLFLDVGNDLRPGVIDHHHQTSLSGSTATLVLRLPELVEGAVYPRRSVDDAFTLVLHEQPDLDGVAASALAIASLTTG